MSWIPAAVNVATSLFSAFSGNSARRDAARQSAEELALQREREANISRLTDEQIAASQANERRANTMFDRYTGTFVPIEDKFIDKVTRGNTPDFEAGLAAADFEKQLGVQRGIIARNLARRGVAPNSGNALELESQLALGGTAGRAAAATLARQDASRRDLAGLQSAVNVGRGLPSSAAGYYSSAASGLSGAASSLGGLADSAARRFAGAQDSERAAGEAMGRGLTGLANSLPGLVAAFGNRGGSGSLPSITGG
jgi:hypothetical protein